MDELVVKDLIDRLIDLSFAEDIGDGDHTTLSCIPADAMGKSKLLIKEEGILAGIEVPKEVFRRFDPTMKVAVYNRFGSLCRETTRTVDSLDKRIRELIHKHVYFNDIDDMNRFIDSL